MYQASKRIISHHKRHVILAWLAVVIVLLSVAGIIIAKFFLNANTVINKPPAPVVSTVIAPNSATKRIDGGIFTLNLPQDWKFTGRAATIYHPYTWENTKGNPGVRTLDIYIDTIPTTLGVNRVLPVEPAGSKVISTTVSDNCASFTGDKTPGAPSTPAKWAQ